MSPDLNETLPDHLRNYKPPETTMFLDQAGLPHSTKQEAFLADLEIHEKALRRDLATYLDRASREADAEEILDLLAETDNFEMLAQWVLTRRKIQQVRAQR